jgi:aminopeptidase N
VARPKRLLPSLLLAALLAGALAPAAGAGGEPFFPRSGNRGYDVSSYDVRLNYQPGSGMLRGEAAIAATASQGLSRFSLDLDRLKVSGVTVDGAAAKFSRGEGKLIVTPAARIAPRAGFEVVVAYGGKPRPVVDPDGTSEGWNRTEDGAFAVGEPVGTAGWLPCNNTLTDKAAFSFELTVPAGLSAVANGRLVQVERGPKLASFAWREGAPMAPYLALVDIGRGKLVRSRAAGLPAWTLVDPHYAKHQRALRAVPEAIRFFSHAYGPYPFDSAGSVIDYAPNLGYALETQTRPIYAFGPDVTTVAHETAHQWFGDSVTITSWPEIWLNEGLATWSQWYYQEHHGGPTVAKTFDRLYATPASDKTFWNPPSAHPGTPQHLFGSSVYARGGLAVQALRSEIGTKALLETLRRWAGDHHHANATIPEFEALAEEVSGRRLTRFFERWLDEPGKPPLS